MSDYGKRRDAVPTCWPNLVTALLGRVVDLDQALFNRSYAGFWVTGPDQAARFSAALSATPSVNVTPSITKGNWFAPFRRRQVFAAA